MNIQIWTAGHNSLSLVIGRGALVNCNQSLIIGRRPLVIRHWRREPFGL